MLLRQTGAQAQAEPGPFVADGGELRFSGAALTELMQGVLARPATFRFRAGGASMSPFVRDGDVISYRRLRATTASSGRCRGVLASRHWEAGGPPSHRAPGTSVFVAGR